MLHGKCGPDIDQSAPYVKVKQIAPNRNGHTELWTGLVSSAESTKCVHESRQHHIYNRQNQGGRVINQSLRYWAAEASKPHHQVDSKHIPKSSSDCTLLHSLSLLWVYYTRLEHFIWMTELRVLGAACQSHKALTTNRACAPQEHPELEAALCVKCVSSRFSSSGSRKRQQERHEFSLAHQANRGGLPHRSVKPSLWSVKKSPPFVGLLRVAALRLKLEFFTPKTGKQTTNWV